MSVDGAGTARAGAMETAVERPRLRPALADVLRAGTLALLAAGLCLAASRRIDERLASPQAANVWFGSDIPYRLDVMKTPGGWDNGGAHPLFPSIGHLLLVGSGLLSRRGDPMRVAGLAGSFAAALFVAVLYALFRRMRLPPLDATLFAAIGATSSGALFWFPVPESFGLAGLGVALALFVAASPRPSVLALGMACAASASCILTNGLVGACAAVAHNRSPRRWPRALVCGFFGLGVMAALWSVQEWAQGTPFFLSYRLLEYEQHLFPMGFERTAQVVQGLLSHPVVAPALQGGHPSFRRVAIASSGPLGAIATLAWLALLGFGIVRSSQLVRHGDRPQLALTAGAGLALMLAMHLTLGKEMFLYAMDVLPLLLALAAASSSLQRGRRFARGLACVLLLAGGVNNLRQFARAAEQARELAAQRVGPAAVVPAEPAPASR
jgi:hypothetical protein